MEELLRRIETAPEVRAFLRSRVGRCFLCEWTLDDLSIRGKLTGQPLDFNGGQDFPAGSKLIHLALEWGVPVPEGTDYGNAKARLLQPLIARLDSGFLAQFKEAR